MDRRRLLAAAALAAAPRAVLAQTPAAPAARRVRPGDPGWPTPGAWVALAAEVGGALITPTSPWTACEGDDRRACSETFRAMRNPFYVGDQPAGTEVYGYLDAWRARPSAFAIRARNAADVAAGVRFAARHNLRLVIKGGGHSYFGGSNAPDSLLIWTRAMNAIAVHDAFVPRDGDGPPQPAVSVGAGCLWIDVYEAVTTGAGRYVQGGGCATVGVAGFIQGGGFGSFSKGFGLGAAGLLEAEVVTADGRIRIVNAHREPDLFWALRGGGGGAFGVVTRMTLRTHALPETFGFAVGRLQARSDDAFRRLIDRFLAFYGEALCNPHWGEQATIGRDNSLALNLVQQGLADDQARAAWAPFLAWADRQGPDLVWSEPFDAGARPARSWWDVRRRLAAGSKAMVPDDRPDAAPGHAWWRGDSDQVSAFLHGYDSLWLPATLLAPARRQRLAGALFAASRAQDVELHFNKGLAGAPAQARAEARATPMNPDVCDAFALAIVATGGPPPLPGLMGRKPDLGPARADARAVARAAAALRTVAPNAGSYVSESDFFNANWREAYWGANHERLRAIKTRADPEGLFWVHNGVGSDAWTDNGFQRA